MYNEHNKKAFLSQFENENTQKVYEAVFKKSEKIEKKLNMDIMNFDKELLEKFIFENMMSKTKQSSRTYCNILSSYIQWSIDNKLSSNIENPININQEYFEKFVENKKPLYISKDEIDAIIFNIVNAQDAFIIKALFEGIQGKQLAELVNLEYKDIVKAEENENVLKLFNDRIVKVETDTIRLAKQAYREESYLKKNGEMDYSENIKDTIKLAESFFVLKPTATRASNNGGKITHYSIYNRLEMIKSLEEFEEYSDALTTKNIVRSGMLYEAKKILERDGELNLSSINEICDKFGMKYKWSLRDFLNEDKINEVYYS